MKILFFDLETNWLFQELGLRMNIDDPVKLGMAVGGVLNENNEFWSFTENNVNLLFDMFRNADFIAGYNLHAFDYRVLTKYGDVSSFKNKTIDMCLIVRDSAGHFVSLDDIASCTVGMKKSQDTMKIPGMWRNGQHQEVIDYLHNDLLMTKAVFDFGRKNGFVRYVNKYVGKKSIKVIW